MSIELREFSWDRMIEAVQAVRDLISLGLVDASWLPRLIPEHAARLQQLLDDPDG